MDNCIVNLYLETVRPKGVRLGGQSEIKYSIDIALLYLQRHLDIQLF